MYVDDIKLAGKKLDRMWKIFMEEVDLVEPTSFLTTFIWVALKDNVK